MVAVMLDGNACPPSHFAMQYIGNLQTSEAGISEILDLNDIKFCRIVKKQFSVTFEKFGHAAPNLHDIVLMTSCEMNQ